MHKPKITELKNGLRIVTVPMKGNPTATVMVFVNTGSRFENRDNNGISHFLEHMCFKGTTNRDGKEIMRYLDGLGATTNAFTWYEMTAYYAKAQKKHYKKILDVVSDIYQNSTFPHAEIEKERGVIIGEIDMNRDQPSRWVLRLFDNLLYGDQPAGWSILGPKENIKKISHEDFVQYYQDHYVAGATTVVVAGDVSHAQVTSDIKAAFADISTARKKGRKKTIQSQKKPAIKTQYKKTDQAHLVLGVRTFNHNHRDEAVADVLSAILGKGMSSRLFEKLRDELGLGYYVRCNHETHSDTGALTVWTGVNNKRVDEGIEAILDEFRRIRDELIDDKELKKVKEFLIGNIKMGLEASDDMAEYYGLQDVLRRGVKTPQDMIREIQAVTARDIRRVARKIFANDRLNLAMIGPFKDEKKFKKMVRI